MMGYRKPKSSKYLASNNNPHEPPIKNLLKSFFKEKDYYANEY
jgi:hypothetical protein